MRKLDGPEVYAERMIGKKQYQDLVNRLVAQYRPEVRVSKQYGVSVLTMRGRAFAGLYRDDMIFRLDGVAYARAAKLKGAGPFEPKAGGPAPGWVSVPVVHVAHWRGLAMEALAGVSEAT